MNSTRWTVEKLGRLAKAVSISPHKLNNWRELVPEKLIPILEKAVLLEEEFDKLGLPCTLTISLE